MISVSPIARPTPVHTSSMSAPGTRSIAKTISAPLSTSVARPSVMTLSGSASRASSGQTSAFRTPTAHRGDERRAEAVEREARQQLGQGEQRQGVREQDDGCAQHADATHRREHRPRRDDPASPAPGDAPSPARAGGSAHGDRYARLDGARPAEQPRDRAHGLHRGAVRLRGVPRLPAAHADRVRRARGVHRGVRVGPRQRAEPAHEARRRDRDRLPADRPRSAADLRSSSCARSSSRPWSCVDNLPEYVAGPRGGDPEQRAAPRARRGLRPDRASSTTSRRSSRASSTTPPRRSSTSGREW